MEDYIEMIRKMSNEDLLGELVSVNQYSPEDFGSTDVNLLDQEVTKEILSRMVNPK